MLLLRAPLAWAAKSVCADLHGWSQSDIGLSRPEDVHIHPVVICQPGSSEHILRFSFIRWRQSTPGNHSVLGHARFWHRQHNLCWSITRWMKRLRCRVSLALVSALANSNNRSGSWVCESGIPADINRAGDTTPLGLAPQKSLQRCDFECGTFRSASLACI